MKTSLIQVLWAVGVYGGRTYHYVENKEKDTDNMVNYRGGKFYNLTNPTTPMFLVISESDPFHLLDLRTNKVLLPRYSMKHMLSLAYEYRFTPPIPVADKEYQELLV